MNRYFIYVKNIDNQLVITLNGNIVFNSGNISGDPQMNLPIEITTLLQANPFVNTLHFDGFNSHYAPGYPGGTNQPNPWHFAYSVVVGHNDSNGNFVVDGPVVPDMDASGISPKDTWIFTQPYSIVKEPESNNFVFKPMELEEIPHWLSRNASKK
jgi:hypothetical protein